MRNQNWIFRAQTVLARCACTPDCHPAGRRPRSVPAFSRASVCTRGSRSKYDIPQGIPLPPSHERTHRSRAYLLSMSGHHRSYRQFTSWLVRFAMITSYFYKGTEVLRRMLDSNVCVDVCVSLDRAAQSVMMGWAAHPNLIVTCEESVAIKMRCAYAVLWKGLLGRVRNE